MPEFLINLSEIPGFPVGRLFVPYSFTTNPTFLLWYKSVRIHRETFYVTGKVIWFIASYTEYCRLASRYPHHRHAAYTRYLLNSASTFFKGLKPPYLPDYEYLD
ncbi:hypothetical protein [Iningainema tapete]|uniref:Uncharacterized protein n=1 Tax=Iningainema tapete BLCC-T55 TaxID=2748662 RepID=A0A8J6XRS8_9CYAN|nr:hypothetical protein [Iningainema tapete]MBD2778031.1 hypothetical protein [Iningainema tapete BLCC-T55]